MAESLQTKPARTFTFKRVEVYVTPGNFKIIEWSLDRCFPLEDSTPVFYVEVAYGGGEWERLNPDDPVVDQCLYVDEAKYRCGKSSDVFYRVIASDGESEYASKPEATLGVWNTHDWLIARDIIRKEYLQLRKYTGDLGYLLKRRTHGVPCQNPSCLDNDLEIPTTTACPQCFGTGFQNGFYNAIPYWIQRENLATNKDVTDSLGTLDPRSIKGRAVAYPRVDEYDMWVDADTNKRYIVRGVQRAAEIRGVPLVYMLVLNEVPASDNVFRVPLEQDVPVPEDSSSSAGDPPTQGGWRQGIGYVEW